MPADTEDDRLRLVRGSLERMTAARTARLQFTVEHHWKSLTGPSRRRRRGGLLRPAGKALLVLGKRGFELAARHLPIDPRRQEGEGILDYPNRRVAMDFGSWAVVIDGENSWSGPSGRRIETLEQHDSGHAPYNPFWVLELLGGVTLVEPRSREVVRGVRCERLDARADLSEASARAPGGMAVPMTDVGTFEDLLRLPLEVWVDAQDGLPRRLRQHSRQMTTTLELFDFGVALDHDWSRLPTLRTPQTRRRTRKRCISRPGWAVVGEPETRTAARAGRRLRRNSAQLSHVTRITPPDAAGA